jgi:hypothetical protein
MAVSYTTSAPTKSPTKSPTSPTKSPTTKSPTNQPTKSPTTPTNAPTPLTKSPTPAGPTLVLFKTGDQPSSLCSASPSAASCRATLDALCVTTQSPQMACSQVFAFVSTDVGLKDLYTTYSVPAPTPIKGPTYITISPTYPTFFSPTLLLTNDLAAALVLNSDESYRTGATPTGATQLGTGDNICQNGGDTIPWATSSPTTSYIRGLGIGIDIPDNYIFSAPEDCSGTLPFVCACHQT